MPDLVFDFHAQFREGLVSAFGHEDLIVAESAFLAGLLLPPGCGKEDVPARAEEVKLHLWQNPPTKTSAVTQLSTVFWGTTTGGDAEGSLPETAEWTVSCATVCALI